MKDKFYYCPICKNFFGVIHDAGVTPICCGKPMQEIHANSQDAAVEKHIPVVKVEGNICYVEVGSVLHPMSEEHWIDWVMVATNLGRHRVVLNPGQEPKVELPLAKDETVLRVYAHCNLHGLWVKEL